MALADVMADYEKASPHQIAKSTNGKKPEKGFGGTRQDMILVLKPTPTSNPWLSLKGSCTYNCGNSNKQKDKCETAIKMPLAVSI